MTASGRFCLAALTLLGSLGYAAQAAAGLLAPAEQNRLAFQLEKRPMVFFLAKGAPDSCGPGCSEWIAAEGKFVPGTAQRFRDLLATLSGKNPPVFFHSLGGVPSDAVRIGFLMRERRMTAGIGRTMPERCRVFSKEDVACQRLISSGGEVTARLLTREGQCHSACVFAFAGASVRQVAPGTKVGVHSIRIDMALKKKMMRDRPDAPEVTVAGAHLAAEQYFMAMGVDPRLVAIGAKVDARRIYVLNRDEIANLGLETRGFYETAWFASTGRSKQPGVSKSITQAQDGGRGEYQTSGVHIRCFNGRTWLLYFRELLANEVGIVASVRIVAGESEVVLVYQGTGDGGRELWSIPVASDFLRIATLASSVVITKTILARNAPGGPQAISVSTAGLTKLMETLLKECGESKSSDITGGQHKS
jgi:hypothetical protein